MTEYYECVRAEQVTEEVLDLAESIFDDWYADKRRIDWTDFTDRMDGIILDNGQSLNLDPNMASTAILRIQRHIMAYRDL